MKHLTVILLLLSSITFAQERMILKSNGELIKLNHKKDLREAITESKIKRNDGKVFNNRFATSSNFMAYNEDTLSYRSLGGYWHTNFGFFGQDVMLMWFEAPADMTIKGIGFTCADDTGTENATISLRLIRLNWTKEQLKNFNNDTQIGYFPSDADGMNNIDFFGETATGDWVSTYEENPLPPWTNHENPDSNTFNYDLLSDNGYGIPITPVLSTSTDPIYQWVTTGDLGFEPEVSKGEIFAVVATHDGVNLDADRIGFWSDETLGYPGWKFYENGKTDATVDAGWWVRMFTWDFAVAVELEEGPYTWISINELPTTLSTEARTVEATINGYYTDSLFSEINLIYTINGGDEISVPMTGNGNIYSADIPGQSPGTEVSYSVRAIDVDGYEVLSPNYYKYKIFVPEHEKFLVVFNGFTSTTGYPQQYYFDGDDNNSSDFSYDAWSYGPLTKELVDNYYSIIEICTSGPSDYNRDVIAEWLSGSFCRSYLLAGEEWLGADNDYIDKDYAAGTFEYDVLGITHSYNDISYDGTAGQELPSKIMPQEGTLIGGKMFEKVAEINAIDSLTVDSVLYNPIYEIGYSNWLDGFEIREDSEVFMKAETRGISGVPAVQEVNTGVSRLTENGNFIVFMAYDPISIHTTPYYYWLGRGSQSNIFQAMEWFNSRCIGDVNDDLTNIKFSLSQNYPNPFNPSTTIKYSIPRSTEYYSVQQVQLKVYDILGREVATLVNKEQKAGNYEVNFNAKKLSSGVYFYKLQSGTFTQSKKMILLK